MHDDFSLLLVEPDVEQQNLIKNVLLTEFEIADIVTCTSSIDAISMLAKQDCIQFIIVNSNLEDGNGFTLTSDIRSINNYSETPILIISNIKDRNHLLKAAASGASDFIVKPFKEKALTLKLKKLLADKQFRKNARLSTLEAFDAELAFNSDTIYACKLIDISIGGCSVKSLPFNHGGTVFDQAFINIKTQESSIAIPAELVRIERDPECEKDVIKSQIAGFEFVSEDISTNKAISDFIESVATMSIRYFHH